MAAGLAWRTVREVVVGGGSMAVDVRGEAAIAAIVVYWWRKLSCEEVVCTGILERLSSCT